MLIGAKQLLERYSKFISESYNHPDSITEKEVAKLFEEQEFISLLISEISFLEKKFNSDNYRSFSSKMAREINRIFHNAPVTSQPQGFHDDIGRDHNKYATSPRLHEEPHFKKQPSFENQKPYHEPPKPEHYSTFGVNHEIPDADSGFIYREKKNEDEGFDNFIEENDHKIQHPDHDQGWKKKDFNEERVDEDNHFKTSKVKSHFNEKKQEPLMQESNIVKSKVMDKPKFGSRNKISEENNYYPDPPSKVRLFSPYFL